MGRFALVAFAVLTAAVIAVVGHGGKQSDPTRAVAPPHTQAKAPQAPRDQQVVYVVESTVGGSRYSIRSDCPQPKSFNGEWTREQMERWTKRCVVREP